jgi:PAS domain S-box-containing protein
MKLLFILATLISGFITISLVFFQATRKTYVGFGRWTAGVGFLTLGYLSLCMRGLIPEPFSILVGNVAFPLGMVLLLDGIKRFLGLSPMSRLWYSLPGLSLATVAGIYYLHDAPAWRFMASSAAISAPHWAMAALIFRHPVKHKSMFYPVIGSTIGLVGLVVLIRPISAFFVPQWHTFMDSPFQMGTLAALIILQLGENLSLIMLNSERVEGKLAEAETELRETVNRLQESLTEQKRVEESLRESEERYRTFFLTSRDCVFMTGADGIFIDFNDAALEMLSYSPVDRQEALSRNVALSYARPEEREAHAAMVAEIGFSKEYPVDLRRKDGTILHTLITAVARRDPKGNVIGFQGTVRDITERKKVEEELRKSRAELYAIYEHSPVMMCVLDGQRQVLYANRALAEFVGKHEDELKEGSACGVFGCINSLDDPRGCGYGPHCE